jgi:hypothetical protein
MDIKDFQTLTGLTLDEVAARLDAELPGNAYTSVPGGADLTDIDPGYMRKTLNEVFGVCGVGWGYKFASADLHTEIENRPRSSGGNRRVYVATLLRLTFWYRLVTGNGNGGDINGFHEIDASGGSENDIESYALKGAITNALGHAASNLGWQQSVYLGLRSHKTVGGRKPAAKSAKPASAPAKPAPAPTASKPAPVASKPASPDASLTPADDLTRFVVKIGKRAGKTLGDVYAEGLEGSKALEFYTTMVTGSNREKEALKNAAISFLAKHNGHIPASTAA